MAGLTVKQEGFCTSYIETGNASEAYRLNYSTQNMNDTSINRAAKELLDNPKITPRLKELKEAHSKRHNITVDSLTTELNEAMAIAREDIKPAAMVTAIMGKAKLHGLLTDKVEITDTSIASRLAAARKKRNGV